MKPMRSPKKSSLRQGLFVFTLLLPFFFFSGCSGFKWFKSKETKELEKTAESLIQEGLDAYQRKNYQKAGEAFQNLKDRFPYHPLSIVAELKLADSHFLNKEYEQALTAYKEFEKLHPTNEVISYVIFQQGMCYFKQMPKIDRDQTYAYKAMLEFNRLIKNYPESEYSSQARDYLLTSQKNLALHEFSVGNFYFKNKDYTAALERFKGIVREFPEAAHPPNLKRQIQLTEEMLLTSQTRSPRIRE